MIFVFPMMGRSSRFLKAGYELPKYQLNLFGRPVFDWVVLGFKNYFENNLFLFPHRNEDGIKEFIQERLKKLGVKKFHLVAISGETLGQADSVLICLNVLNYTKLKQELIIFNVDSFRPNFSIQNHSSDVDGYLEVFEGVGDSWSFILLDKGNFNRVIKTAEKKRISNLCSTGLYFFKSTEVFCKLATQSKEEELWKFYADEFYVAPLFNTFIINGYCIGSQLILSDQVIFCGVPKEYEDLLKLESDNFKKLFENSNFKYEAPL